MICGESVCGNRNKKNQNIAHIVHRMVWMKLRADGKEEKKTRVREWMELTQPQSVFVVRSVQNKKKPLFAPSLHEIGRVCSPANLHRTNLHLTRVAEFQELKIHRYTHIQARLCLESAIFRGYILMINTLIKYVQSQNEMRPCHANAHSSVSSTVVDGWTLSVSEHTHRHTHTEQSEWK